MGCQKVNLRVEVKDTTRRKGDQVQVFLAEEIKGTGAATSEADLSAKKKNPPSANGQYTFKRDGGKGKDKNTYNVQETKTGYVVYASLPMSAALLTEGQVLSLDFRITDEYAAGKTATIVWNDSSNQQPDKPANRGKLKLGSVLKQTKVTYGKPVIDAKKDNAWKKAASVKTDVWVVGNSGATATAQLLWDEKYLYVLADVKDPLRSKLSSNAHEQDSIEIFIDPSKDQTTFYQEDDAQYRVNFDNEASFGGNARKESFKSATRLTSGGYTVEVAIPLDSVRAEGQRWIGFDLQVNDDGAGDGKRSSVSIWSDSSGNSYQDTSGFGSLLLTRK